MASYVQADRHLTVATPLGEDALLLTEFDGSEGLSQLFRFRLGVIAENGTAVDFEKLLGQKITATLALAGGEARHFNGICSRVGEGVPDATFTPYQLEIVPQPWFLTRIAQSRIFQQVTVPDILKQVFQGLDVDYQLQGTYEPRDFCAQYRETDFAFASRLMEEEGIFYFFKHRADGHTMVLGDDPQAHPDLPIVSRIEFEDAEGGVREPDRIHAWEKSQELRSGKVTLWDHCFELPHKHLEADKPTLESALVGGVTHKLKVGRNDRLELYDYPGGYAQRFDGIDPGGGERAADLSKIFADNQRTVGLRMQEEAAQALLIRGSGYCRYLASGHKFTLARRGAADGQYVVVGVHHVAKLAGDYRSGRGGELAYENSFTCIPAALPFRPVRSTPRPVVHGTQTAVVVGPAGDEIFCDKYGRVKVQFHWDRQGQNDANSSCWVRVGTPWAGRQWGAIHIPRVGQEVLIAFEEGDPDRPIIVGGVYNADQMPPYTLPDNKTQSGLKSRSTLSGTPDNFNELRFEDKKGSEQVYFHAEKDFDRVVENNDTLQVGVPGPSMVEGSQTTTIYKDRTETIKTGNETLDIKMGNRTVVIHMGNDSLTLKMGNQTTKLDLGASSTEAMQSIELKVGQSSIKVDQMGVTIKGMKLSFEGMMMTEVKAPITQINGDAMLKCQGGITMIN